MQERLWLRMLKPKMNEGRWPEKGDCFGVDL